MENQPQEQPELASVHFIDKHRPENERAASISRMDSVELELYEHQLDAAVSLQASELFKLQGLRVAVRGERAIRGDV